MARPVRIAVLGADGRMGRALVRAVLAATPRAVLAAASERPGHVSVGKDAGVLAGIERAGVAITGTLRRVNRRYDVGGRIALFGRNALQTASFVSM